MKKITPYKINATLFFIVFFLFFNFLIFSVDKRSNIFVLEVDLNEIFNNQLVIDTNSDKIPDDITARFLIDAKVDSVDIEAAATIAARLGFETCAMDLSLYVKSREEAKRKKVRWLIIFSSTGTENLETCGVRVYREDGFRILEVFGSSPKSRRYAAVNFFSRYPYIWDVVGRETGKTWQHVKEDILLRLPKIDRKSAVVRITSVFYRYKKKIQKSVTNRRLERFGLTGTIRRDGEVEGVEVKLDVPSGTEKIALNFKNLTDSHTKGEFTDILNYTGLKKVIIHITAKGEKRKIVQITRTAFAQRFLNRSFDPSFFQKKVEIKDKMSDIAGFYTYKGIYRDIEKNGFSDRLITKVVYDGTLQPGMIDLAARIGLEDCSVSLPFTVSAENFNIETIKNLERPLLIGNNNRFVDYLRKIGKVKTPKLKPDEGIIQFSSGFNRGGAYIISGSTPTGENAALRFTAETLPYISSIEPGSVLWEDLNREVELFFSRKSDAGKTAWGILQVDMKKKMFSAADLKCAQIQFFTMRPVKKLKGFILNRFQPIISKVRINKKPKFTIKTGGRLEGTRGFSDRYTPEWEVTEFRRTFNMDVLPKLRKIAKNKAKKPLLFIDLRLSEPAEVLYQQVSWIREKVTEAGIMPDQIKTRAIIAYKQGFHWLKDDVLLRLKAIKPYTVTIRFSPTPPDFLEFRKYWPEPVRWLQELYPVDEILARELSIPLASIRFIKDRSLNKVTYKLTALNKTGDVLLEETFTPFTEEVYFQDRFPGWGKVKVATGGLIVNWNGKEIFSTHFDTDPLRLWKHYQKKILPKLTKMIEKQAKGPLKMEDQPFFDKLEVKVRMSEPDYRLGLDEEIVSSLESFHEDLYLNTLDYFSGLVKKDPDKTIKDPLMARRWAAPGNIIPIIYPSSTGKGPLMETVFSGLESLYAKVEMEFLYDKLQKPVKVKKKITPFKIKPPRLTGIVVCKDARAREALYTLKFEKEEDLSNAIDMLRILCDLKRNKIFSSTFLYPNLSTIRFYLLAPDLQTEFVLDVAQPPEKKISICPEPITRGDLQKALSRVMNPKETFKISNSLGLFSEINYYIGGYSYQGRPIPVLEIGLKPKGKIVSRKKLITYKPTIFILGRQHANEVSSTNYGFNIAWLLAKDPKYRKYLEQLNVIIEPMENPDGSALAVKLQKLTPHHMLHAGRYSALGTDIGYHINNPDTLITEARVRKKLYDRWLPDIFLNNHGYPSHEWVQQFSNYTPYQFRAYWIPRGWYYFHIGFSSIASPFHKAAGERVVKIISKKMKGDKVIFETNLRIYERYRRWAERWQPHLHYLELYDGTNIYKARRGSTAPRLTKRRKITVLEAIPEAMDETAQDKWLKLAIRQGTLFITSYMDFAIESTRAVERIEEEFGNAVHIRIVRHRPIRNK